MTTSSDHTAQPVRPALANPRNARPIALVPLKGGAPRREIQPPKLPARHAALARAFLFVESRVDRYTIAIGEPVGLVRHADDRHQLAEHGLASAPQ
jgi:hypothetical protein